MKYPIAYLGSLLLHLLIIMSNTFWNGWFCDSYTDNFDSRCIPCTVLLDCFLHDFIYLHMSNRVQNSRQEDAKMPII